MQKSLFKNIFEPLIFICNPIFNIFAAHFRTKGILNNDKIMSVLRMFHNVVICEKSKRFEKPASKRCCIGSSHQVQPFRGGSPMQKGICSPIIMEPPQNLRVLAFTIQKYNPKLPSLKCQHFRSPPHLV